MKSLEPWVRAKLTRLSDVQARFPLRLILVSLLLTAVAALLALRLELRPQLSQLLPEGQPSVLELERLRARTSGVSNLFIVIEGGDVAARRKLGDDILPDLRALGPRWVGSAEDGVQAARNYLRPRAMLFLAPADLEKLRDDLDDRFGRAVSRELGMDLEEDDDADQKAKPFDSKALKEKLGPGVAELDRFPDGYFENAERTALVVAIRSPVEGGDPDDSTALIGKVKDVVARHQKSLGASELRVGYAGDVVTGLFEYGAVQKDLSRVGIFGVLSILAVILLYFRRIRVLFLLGAVVVAGGALTFGLTKLVIGHLNIATGFLFSVVAGNGINSGIIYLSRYLEERNKGHDVAQALGIAHSQTWAATLSAALAAAVSYGSLAFTNFRGFKHLALVGSSGMVFYWIAAYGLLPALLVVSERLWPVSNNRRTARFDAPFVFLVRRAARPLTVLGVVLAAAGVLAVVRYVQSDPLEYELKRIGNDVPETREQYRLSSLAAAIVGTKTESAMAVLCDRLDQVSPLKHALEAKRDSVPREDRPFETVYTLQDFVPLAQAEKIPVALAVKKRVLRAHARGGMSDADFAEMEPFLPPDGVAPFGIADLPEALARPFSERDGTRGKLLFIEPTSGKSDSDARYLIRFADAFRSTRLPNGEVIGGSGRAVVFADLIRAVVVDMPRALLISFLATSLVLLAFRRDFNSLRVLLAWGIGLAWLGGIMQAMGLRLNFLNFVAVPVTFGIGVDYAVNFVERHAESRDVLGTLRSTGGAVILSSLTTILGYLALLGSLNRAVASLGKLAVLGEVCCLSAALLVLPAVLLVRERRTESSPPDGDIQPLPGE
ncbi:MAG TPA: MMPL family transporter [Polyangiaceae bacterium]|nr:MMPL family transporter [Polyangiaceae bacterium]